MKYLLIWSLSVVALFLMMISPIIIQHARAFVKDVVEAIKAPSTTFVGKRLQAGFVTLLRPYGGYAQGNVVELPPSTEATLIASGGATTSAGPATAGALTTNQPQGAGAIAAGTLSTVITCPLVSPQSIVFAVINQTTADSTLLRIERVVPGIGFFTVFGNANATAITGFDWAIIPPIGSLSNPG